MNFFEVPSHKVQDEPQLTYTLLAELYSWFLVIFLCQVPNKQIQH